MHVEAGKDLFQAAYRKGFAVGALDEILSPCLEAETRSKPGSDQD